MTKKQNKDNCVVNFVSSLLSLLQKNVPVLALWEQKGELKHLGTTEMSDWFEKLDVDTKQRLKSSMVEDMINLTNNNEDLKLNPGNIPDHVRASSLYKSLINHPSEMPTLPFPLSVMSKKEKSKYLCDLIASEAKDKKIKVVYGSEICKPSFWLEDDWSWSNLKQTLTKTEEKMFTGQGSWTDFLSKTIRTLFESKSLDPENHVQNLDQKTKTLKKKKRIFGINDPPSVISENNQNPHQISSRVDVPQILQEQPEVENSEPEEDNSDLNSLPLTQQYISSSITTSTDRNNIPQEFIVTTTDLNNFTQQSMVPSTSNIISPQQSFIPVEENNRQGTQLYQKDLTKPSASSAMQGDVQDSCGETQTEQQLQGVSTTLVRHENGVTDACTAPVVSVQAPPPDASNVQNAPTSADKSPESRRPFKPRRTVGDSPFKVPTLQASRKSKIAMKDLDLNPMTDRANAAKFLDVPLQVKGHLKNCKVEWNSGGGSCLFKSAAQHVSKCGLGASDVSYVELRRCAHKKLVEWWPFFASYYVWPTIVTVGAGDNSRMESFANAAEYIKFLESDDSLNAFSDTEVDLWVLAYMLNTTIWVLSYNLPHGEGLDGGRCIWRFFPGQGATELDKFSCNSDVLYLLHEHLVHWSRIISVEGADAEASCSKLSEDPTGTLSTVFDQSSMKLKAAGSHSSSKEVTPAKSKLRKRKVSKKTSQSSPSKKKSIELNRKTNKVISDKVKKVTMGGKGMMGRGIKAKKDEFDLMAEAKEGGLADIAKKMKRTKLQLDHRKKTSKTKKGSEDSPATLGSKQLTGKRQNKFCVNNPKRRRKENKEASEIPSCSVQIIAQPFLVKDRIMNISDGVMATKSDVYHVFPLKELSLEEVLSVPSEAELAKEVRLDKLDEEIAERKANSERESSLSNEIVDLEKTRLRLWKLRLKENASRRNKIEAELSESMLSDMFEKNKDYFEKIKNGEEYSARHEAFNKGGVYRDRLRDKMIVNPFTDEHERFTIEELHKMLGLSSVTEKMMHSNYIWKVLLPECFIKVNFSFSFQGFPLGGGGCRS